MSSGSDLLVYAHSPPFPAPAVFRKDIGPKGNCRIASNLAIDWLV
jgi:hypothetical protein